MNEAPTPAPAQDRYQWRLYTAAAAGASFLAGMLVNNWIERRIRAVPGHPRPQGVGAQR